MIKSAALAQSSKTRSRVTNHPAQRHGRTAAGRRIRDLFGAYMLRLGDPSDVDTQALALAAAEMVAISERARADHIANPTNHALEIVNRAEGKAGKALRRLGLDKVGVPNIAPNASKNSAMNRVGT